MNNKLNNRRLKLATRELLSRFDNLAHAASCCRVHQSHLSDYQNHDHSSFMPADVTVQLEWVVGESIVTDVQHNINTEGGVTGYDDLKDGIVDLSVAIGTVSDRIREAMHPDSQGGTVLTENEKRNITAAIEDLSRVASGLRRGTSGPQVVGDGAS